MNIGQDTLNPILPEQSAVQCNERGHSVAVLALHRRKDLFDGGVNDSSLPAIAVPQLARMLLPDRLDYNYGYFLGQ